MTRRSILTVLAAVLGLALSAALAWSASQLAGQRIGLASEPLAVTQGLAPRHRAAPVPRPIHDHHKVGAKPSTPRKAATTSSPQIFSATTAPPAPVTPVAPAPSATTSAAPPAARTTASSSSPAPPSSPSQGASRHRDDHHPDD